MKGKMILLVEDEAEVQKHNKRMLELRGFTTHTAMNLAEAQTFLAHTTPAAIILDRGLPDGNGLDFLREFRKTFQIPVLLLTGFGEAADVMLGFETGCNDYLPKPYTFGVLLVRLTRLLESAEAVPETIIKGLLTLNLKSLSAYINGVNILLTQKEFALLLMFVQNEDRNISAEYLYEQVWGLEMVGEARAVKFQISNLRKKLEGSGYTVLSTRGEGYCFERE
jgi:DNA-binding response OmpR family regulator